MILNFTGVMCYLNCTYNCVANMTWNVVRMKPEYSKSTKGQKKDKKDKLVNKESNKETAYPKTTIYYEFKNTKKLKNINNIKLEIV